MFKYTLCCVSKSPNFGHNWPGRFHSERSKSWVRNSGHISKKRDHWRLENDGWGSCWSWRGLQRIQCKIYKCELNICFIFWQSNLGADAPCGCNFAKKNERVCWNGDAPQHVYVFLSVPDHVCGTKPGEHIRGCLYLSKCCQWFIDGGCLHQPLTLSFGLGDPFRSSKITQGQRTTGSQSGHFIWALHLQRHHQVRPRTEEEADYTIKNSDFYQL